MNTDTIFVIDEPSADERDAVKTKHELFRLLVIYRDTRWEGEISDRAHVIQIRESTANSDKLICESCFADTWYARYMQGEFD